MFNLEAILNQTKVPVFKKDKAAKLLSTNPEYLQKFEEAYRDNVLFDEEPEDFFAINSKQMSKKVRTTSLSASFDEAYLQGIIDRIVKELTDGADSIPPEELVTNDDLKKIPVKVRPQLTGTLSKVDLSGPPSYFMVLNQWNIYKNGRTAKERQHGYNMFRQGLDILDLDGIMYQIIDMNPNSMGYWFPPLETAVQYQTFFKVPKTKIVKVPLPILQLTRLSYESLTLSTLKIVDDWAMKAFDLDVNKTYFVKTGTYSSKFDFRNARVTGEKEVRELGEYLVFIQNQAVMMAGPLNPVCHYGVSTTTEFVVREWIEDVENNPCIYKGMPLHTEFRAFVDFDTNKVMGIFPYWDPDVMKNRFLNYEDADSPHQKHDYIIYKAHEPVLMKRYEENKDKVVQELSKLLPTIDLHGQWSVDIMKNGDDYYIIDMALAQNSAFVERLPKGMLRRVEENWIPDFSNRE